MSLYDKYNIVLTNNERFYVESLTERNFVLDGATPIYLMVGDTYLSERSWIGLIPKIAIHFQKLNPKSPEELLEYRTPWSKTQIFTYEKKTNYSPVFDSMYINTNHTSVHSMWLIQDLIKFYNIDPNECTMLIKKPPLIEPKEVIDHVLEYVRGHFIDFLREKKLDKETIERVTKGMDFINKIQAKLNKNYYNFYLLDNPYNVANHKSRFLKDYKKAIDWDEKQLSIAKKYLDLYTDFCNGYFH